MSEEQTCSVQITLMWQIRNVMAVSYTHLDVYKRQLQSQHNLNISGGTDKVRYFISAGAYTQGGLFSEFEDVYKRQL